MKNLNTAKKNVLGNMIIRQTMGGSRKEDKIRCKDELIERIKEEYAKQNSVETHVLDLTMLDVSLVEDMSNLFSICYSYDLESIDVSNWNVSNVEYMIGMFYECSSLESINVSKWDISKCRNISGMFYGCSSLKSIDVSNWNVSNVEYMIGMFNGCNFDYKKEDNKLYKV